MPKGSRGEKRPAEVIGNAVKVMRIATGEETEDALSCEAGKDNEKIGDAKRKKRQSENK
jgi:hypothetical protein